jgi:hypothetical protein
MRPLDLGQDVRPLGTPPVRLGIELAFGQVHLDGKRQVANAVEAAFARGLAALALCETSADQRNRPPPPLARIVVVGRSR